MKKKVINAAICDARAVTEDKRCFFNEELASADKMLNGRGQMAQINRRDHKHHINVDLKSASLFSVIRVGDIEAFDLVSRAVKDDGCGIGKLRAATAGGKGND